MAHRQTPPKAKLEKLIRPEAIQRAQHQHLVEAESAEALAKKNQNFLQIEKKTLKDLRRLVATSVPAAQVIMLLGEKMNRSNAVVCSFKTLTEITNYSRSTLAVAVKLLEAERWVQIVKIGSANAYVVNSRVFWQNTGDKKRHASFHATIVASESEQDEGYIENWEEIELRQFPVLNRKAGEKVLVYPNDPQTPPDQAELDV